MLTSPYDDMLSYEDWDAGYIGADKREELKDRDVNWQIAMKRGKLKAVSEESGFGQLLRKLE